MSAYITRRAAFFGGCDELRSALGLGDVAGDRRPGPRPRRPLVRPAYSLTDIQFFALVELPIAAIVFGALFTIVAMVLIECTDRRHPEPGE